MSLYRRNAGGGGSFLTNDFLCRDILLLVKDLLQNITTKQIKSEDLIATNCSIKNIKEFQSRSAKLQQLVNETLWRFKLVKTDLVKLEFGMVSNILNEANSTKFKNNREETVIYELMKKKKHAETLKSNESYSIGKSFEMGMQRRGSKAISYFGWDFIFTKVCYHSVSLFYLIYTPNIIF